MLPARPWTCWKAADTMISPLRWDPARCATEARVRIEDRVPATRRGTAPLGRARLRLGRRH